jgi:integrase
MSVFKRGNVYWYKFTFAGQRVVKSTKTKKKALAQTAERNRRKEFEESFAGITRERKERVKAFAEIAAAYENDYKVRHPNSSGFVKYAVQHLAEHLGTKLMMEIDVEAIKAYQVARLKEKGGPKTINEEVGELLRIMGERGDILRVFLRKKKLLRLRVPMGPGKPFTVPEQDALTAAARQSRSPHLKMALVLAQNAGMRDAEIKGIQWTQFRIDRETNILTVGKGKTVDGEGRTIPLNAELLRAILEHRAWYEKQFGPIQPGWYVFPFGRRGKMDPTRPVTTLKTAWQTAKKKAGVKGRWHDNRHNLITELGELGAGEETIKSIAGHVSAAMLKRYSHIRIKAKREALEAVLVKRQQNRDELSAAQTS